MLELKRALLNLWTNKVTSTIVSAASSWRNPRRQHARLHAGEANRSGVVPSISALKGVKG